MNAPTPPRRRRRLFAATVLTLGGLVLLFALALGLAASFGGELLKGAAIRAMARHDRVLRLDETPRIAFWPRLELAVGPATLSAPGGGPFAAVAGATIALEPGPLLSGRIVVDRAAVSGFRADLVRHRDGSFNFADLLPRTGGSPLQAEIGGLEFDGRLDLQDEASGRALTIEGIRLTAGTLRADTGAHVFGVGDAALAFRTAAGSAKAEAADVAVEGPRLRVGRLAAKVEAATGSTRIEGHLAGALEADLAAGTLRLPQLSGDFLVADARMAAKRARLTLSGTADAVLAPPSVRLDLKGRLDESAVAARVELARLSPLDLALEADVDRIDLDRYLPESAAGESHDGFPALGELGVHGAVRIGHLRLAGVEAENVRLNLGK